MKRAYVLGASKNGMNIGSAICRELFETGWEIRANDCMIGDGSRPPGGNIPNAEIAREHGYVETSKGWYARYDAPSVLDFQKIDADACIITLGSTYKDHFSEVKEHDLERVIRACLTLPLIAARRYVQGNREHLDAYALGRDTARLRHIVFIGSYAHRHPFTNGTAYCAAKAGLDMAARTLGWELTDRGYRVHIVHPYHVQGTPMWSQVERDVMESKGMTHEEADAYNRKDLKMPDLLTPEEVASIVRVLLTEPSMEWLSGTAIELNGGSR